MRTRLNVSLVPTGTLRTQLQGSVDLVLSRLDACYVPTNYHVNTAHHRISWITQLPNVSNVHPQLSSA